jgi:hypothetical protein
MGRFSLGFWDDGGGGGSSGGGGGGRRRRRPIVVVRMMRILTSVVVRWLGFDRLVERERNVSERMCVMLSMVMVLELEPELGFVEGLDVEKETLRLVQATEDITNRCLQQYTLYLIDKRGLEDRHICNVRSYSLLSFRLPAFETLIVQKSPCQLNTGKLLKCIKEVGNRHFALVPGLEPASSSCSLLFIASLVTQRPALICSCSPMFQHLSKRHSCTSMTS